MPDMNGFELYREIKERDPNAKMCFLTASELYYREFRTKVPCVGQGVIHS